MNFLLFFYFFYVFFTAKIQKNILNIVFENLLIYVKNATLKNIDFKLFHSQFLIMISVIIIAIHICTNYYILTILYKYRPNALN